MNRISIHFPAEFDLSFDLVAFCHSHIAHIVCNSGNSKMRTLYYSDCSPHPVADPLLDISIAPMARNDLSLYSHPCDDMSELTAAMSSLVLIHLVHVDRVIRNLFSKLRMQMQKRLAVFIET